MAAQVELSVVCMDSEIWVSNSFLHTKNNHLALIKMPNFKYMSVLFDFGDHFSLAYSICPVHMDCQGTELCLLT